MVNEKLIKQTTIVFAEIQKKLVDPTFKFSQGGATIKVLSNFLNLFGQEYGTVSKERLVDFCVYAAHIFKHIKRASIKQIFGPSSVKRFRNNNRNDRYHEDRWLSSVQLSREYLVNMIADRQEHPQAKYIYVEAEEYSKKRLLNTEIGYVLCQTSTLGWSPVSETCNKCTFTQQCKKETQSKYPELYRIRLEYGSKTNR